MQRTSNVGAFGSAVDVRTRKTYYGVKSYESVYLLARLARLARKWMYRSSHSVCVFVGSLVYGWKCPVFCSLA